ncbi:PAS domain S-box protein [Paraburkholderia tropica]|uniref:PAS domain-containing sensor histidine kinase n=1 Tax=Paraburkholderia tropica TaxID=92647 RepID=UPI0007EC5C3B|nr:PAS domain S-box protein [Paraburkholderia tropica]OBR52906.1 histidine kinase [Paraburkholderia tropica]
MAQGNLPPHNFADLSEVEIDHRYRLLIDAVHDYAIFMLDRSGNVASWNPGAQRTKGYSPGEIIGRHFSVFYTEEDALAGKPARLLAAARDCGRAEDEGWRIRKDGSRFWANVVITAVRDEGGDLVGYAKITRDLTDSRRLKELERFAADSALVQSAREDEKKRIARELHDDLGQRISALKMTLAMHEADISKYLAANVSDRMSGIRELATQLDAMATAMRRIAADLRPPMLDDLGLEAALEWMTENFKVHYGIPVQCEIDADQLHLNDLAAISLFRVVQEALTNIARHAKASHVAVTLSTHEKECDLRICDDGVGIPAESELRPDAFGMRGMRERIAQLGGRLSVVSGPGQGVTVVAKVPLSRITVPS